MFIKINEEVEGSNLEQEQVNHLVHTWCISVFWKLSFNKNLEYIYIYLVICINEQERYLDVC